MTRKLAPDTPAEPRRLRVAAAAPPAAARRGPRAGTATLGKQSQPGPLLFFPLIRFFRIRKWESYTTPRREERTRSYQGLYTFWRTI